MSDAKVLIEVILDSIEDQDDEFSKVYILIADKLGRVLPSGRSFSM